MDGKLNLPPKLTPFISKFKKICYQPIVNLPPLLGQNFLIYKYKS